MRADQETTGDLPEPREADLPEADIVEESPDPDPLEELTVEQRLERERDEYYENWMRAQADFKNLRRRQQQVLEAATSATRRELLAELLLVVDYLDMALLTPAETAEGKNLLLGIQMTRDQVMQLLSQREVELIDTSGAFNPAVHEAVETVTDTGAEPGTIVGTMRRGYLLGKDVLRHAHVKVAAGPDANPTPEASRGEERE